jgi:Tfp pilus assembly protein PilF
MTVAPAIRGLGVSLLLLIGLSFAARAEMVEVAPGISVTKKIFDAPLNEQPFYGFMTFDAELKEANEKFVAAALALAAGDRRKAVEEIVRRGWSLINEGKFEEATARFNQAFLVDPRQSRVYHSLGVIADVRFQDKAYAEELFKIAKTLPNPMPSLNADYGRLLVLMDRPREAEPLLEQATKDTPGVGTAWANLGYARLESDDRPGACAAFSRARQLRLPETTQFELSVWVSRAQCGEAK